MHRFPAMRILIPVQAVLTSIFIGAVWLHVVLRCPKGDQERPIEPGLLKIWYDLPGHFEFNLILFQVLYPLFWLLTRRCAWPKFWRVIRTVHLIASLAVVALVIFFFLFSWIMEKEGGWRT